MGKKPTRATQVKKNKKAAGDAHRSKQGKSAHDALVAKNRKSQGGG